jgi:hypothetical protein
VRFRELLQRFALLPETSQEFQPEIGNRTWS